jgi:hypothetical protein
MSRRGQFTWTGLLAVVGTVAAMAATMVVAAPGGAATPEREYTTSFTPRCVDAPGVLNIETQPSMELRFRGPESVAEGQSGIEFTNASVSLVVPAKEVESFLAVGAQKINGKLTDLTVDATNMEPKELNIARPIGPPPLPGGLPFEVPTEGAGAKTVTIPNSGTFSFGPYTVTGKAGEEASLSLDATPGFTEEPEKHFQATGKGIVFEVEGVNEKGERVIGPLTTSCTGPQHVILANMAITTATTTTTTTTTTTCERIAPPFIREIHPNSGPEGGGNAVTISGPGVREAGRVMFGTAEAHITLSTTEGVVVTAPPGRGTVGVTASRTGGVPCQGPETSNAVAYTYLPPTQRNVEYKNWVVSGTVTDKKLGQAIALPEGARFNGSAEANTETGNGSVKGTVTIPPFTAPLKLFGLLPVSLGLTLTEVGTLEGTLVKSGMETLSMPLKLNVGVTGLKLLGLSVPTKCAAKEPLTLGLSDNPSFEELLSTGFSFTGTSTIPTFNCEGGLLGTLFGQVLSALLSGPENPYAIKFAPPV